ncbi:hypothetical protein PCANC_05226 [Puccinia coronata f. sp. avenae]|uniref:Uncharacterized protein n=1 Tax=Puccinia coronata f. sp. avenae TaxID=200324 RepID=A0A2N5TJ62_9BASI|nr:hypothetical protein PCASD_23356 [Puccinia coronata f. sp. avenae]PLW54300.1 hypothetical protein PCANC_05226 [Puccinia coronata f. sp. avenae]
MPPKKAIKKKAPPKKPTRGQKPTKKAAEVSTDNDPAEKTTGHLKKDNYLVIIDWLKIKKNYDAFFGTGKAPLVGRPPKGTINGFELMAINLRNQSTSKISLSSRQMKDCFNSYKDKYKKTHTLSLATGFGLTPEDRQTGIQTIEQKLDSLCPHYQAMHELMGNKAFVNPLYKVDAQKDVETTNSSDSDDSDNPDDSDNSDESDDSDDSDDSDSGKGKDDSDNGKGKDSDIGELGHDDPEGQNMHTDPALDPDLLDYNPQNQQRPTTSPNDVPQQSSQRKRKQNTRYHQRRNALTAEERALDSSSSDGSLSSEVIAPTKSPKKKNKKNKKKKAKVSPDANNLATHPSPSKTPQNTKGKQRASNSDNINPRSHSTPASKKNNAFAHYEEYALKREAGKAQVAQESLDFEINKYQRQLAIDNKTVELEEKKFMRLSKLEEKKWERELKMDEKRLEWEKDEKAKDRTFELSKLGTLADKENLGKKYELVTQCVTSGKSTEEIERLAKLFQ